MFFLLFCTCTFLTNAIALQLQLVISPCEPLLGREWNERYFTRWFFGQLLTDDTGHLLLVWLVLGVKILDHNIIPPSICLPRLPLLFLSFDCSIVVAKHLHT
uniref:Putative secreted protein n=1 Tax=Anopheles marajoara TaxID=58244 RepID=A0A2M4C8J7_9DIPT